MACNPSQISKDLPMIPEQVPKFIPVGGRACRSQLCRSNQASPLKELDVEPLSPRLNVKMLLAVMQQFCRCWKD